MADQYIRPEDVNEENTRRVLEFLNSARSAEEIAQTIEIPGELDVGLRVAQRILDRRAALDGGFTSLEQVAAVPYVGPERFSEIVSVLTGMQPPGSARDAGFQARVLRELQTLRSMVASLQAGAAGPRYAITLRATRENAFVGQPIPLIIEVKDRISGKPRPNARLTATAGWGNLESQVGFEVKTGRAVTVYTDLKGRIQLTFLPPTAESLSKAQQVAMETALRELDPEAHNPLAILPQLEQMVRRYRADSDKALRSAVDIYFSERQEQLTRAVNPGTAMGRWYCVYTPITAHLHEDHHNAGVESTAVLNLCLKDWLRPWYVAYLGLIENESTLIADIETIGSQTQESTELLDGILSNVYGFIGVQTGRVGEAAGQKIAQKAVNHFMATGFEQLPLASQQSIYPALGIAAKSIRADTMGSLAVSTRIRKDVKSDVAAHLEPLGDLGAFSQSVDTVQSDLAQFQSDYTTFQQGYQTFNNNYEAFSANYNQFATAYSQFAVDYNQFTIDYGDFAGNVGTFNTNYALFDAKYQDFSEKQSTFSSSYSTFSADYKVFENNLSKFSSNFQQFKTDYARFRTDFDTGRSPVRG